MNEELINLIAIGLVTIVVTYNVVVHSNLFHGPKNHFEVPATKVSAAIKKLDDALSKQ